MGKLKKFIDEWNWYWKSRYEAGKQEAEALKTKQKNMLKRKDKNENKKTK